MEEKNAVKQSELELIRVLLEEIKAMMPLDWERVRHDDCVNEYQIARIRLISKLQSVALDSMYFEADHSSDEYQALMKQRMRSVRFSFRRRLPKMA